MRACKDKVKREMMESDGTVHICNCLSPVGSQIQLLTLINFAFSRRIRFILEKQVDGRTFYPAFPPGIYILLFSPWRFFSLFPPLSSPKTFSRRRFPSIVHLFSIRYPSMFDFRLTRTLLATRTIYLTFHEMIHIIYKRGRAPRRGKYPALAVEDSDRFFGKVDTVAPGKAVPVMRTSRFHPCSSERAPFIHGRVCYINGAVNP